MINYIFTFSLSRPGLCCSKCNYLTLLNNFLSKFKKSDVKVMTLVVLVNVLSTSFMPIDGLIFKTEEKQNFSNHLFKIITF